MKLQKYTLDNIIQMDPMHDCTVEEIILSDKKLIISYDNLDSFFNRDGSLSYSSKKLKIEYKLKSDCNVAVISWKNKVKTIDFSDVVLLMKEYEVLSYKYSIDSMCKLTLHFDLNKKKTWNYKKDWLELEIEFYASEVIYNWS